jgi:Mannosyl-glycoprotein endo-beta-N-acetylglucosaminidase
MGHSILSADDLARWFNANRAGRDQPRLPAVNNDIHVLAQIFLDEGAREGVRGDIAFVQSVIETGWFVYSDSGQIRPEFNNYAGINANDGRRKGTTCAEEALDAPLASRCFPTPQIGVRVQIHLLRGYADPSSRNLPDRLRMPPSDRIGLAPWWEYFGGNSPTGKLIWASAPDYGIRILQLYSTALTFNGQPPLGIAGTDPIGAVDGIWRVPGGLRVAGWSIDPQTAAPIAVTAWNNGQPTTFTTDVHRPDLAEVYPAYGGLHGFDRVVPAPAGTYPACIAGENTGAGTSTWLSCRMVTVSNQPEGVLDVVQATFGGATIAGWALDPDSADPVGVHIYVDGAFHGDVMASVSRPDVAAAYPAYGDVHGFSTAIDAGGGPHEVCAFAINTGPGNLNPLIGCRTVAVPANPVGSIDVVAREPDSIRVAGWMLDPDVSTPIDAHVYVDNIGTSVRASAARPDVAAAYPGYGAEHGFDRKIPAGPGPHTVCIAAANQGPGEHVWLGCQSLSANPFGHVDVVGAVPGGIHIAGWMLDPDVGTPIDAHVYVDAIGVSIGASAARPDVAAAYPGYGAEHGLDHVLPAGPGPHTVCIAAANQGPGESVWLACADVSVS